MNISMISTYPVILDGLSAQLINKFSGIFTYNSLNALSNDSNINDYEILIYTIFKENLKEINELIAFKQNNINLKIIVIDFTQSKDVFFKISKSKIEGYILGNFSKEDLNYAIHKISSGNRFYDRELLYKMADNDKSPSIIPLTKREKEILFQLSNGLSNYEISYNLDISENTVKKHISNIFIKINVKDRTQAAIYAYDIGLVDKPISNI